MTRIANAACLLALTVSLSGCRDDEPQDGFDATFGDVPACSDIWVAGGTVPVDYAGCHGDDVIEAVFTFDCKDGRVFVSHAPGYGIVGDEVHVTPEGLDEPDTSSPEYKTLFDHCMGYDTEEPTVEPTPTDSPAANSTPDCVTEQEFDSVQTGDTRRDVDEAFGPRAAAGDLGNGTVTYVACDYQHAAIMSFDDASPAAQLTAKDWSEAS